MNLALTVAYDGTPFLGWQKTKEGPSIEETLSIALEQILQHKVTLQAASRTDAHVHAKGQIVNFTTDNLLNINELKNSLNDILPKEIAILTIKEMPPSFHPTLDCIKKEYHYYICNSDYQLPWFRSFSWHFYKPLDLSLMQQAAAALIGMRDFSAFCNMKKGEAYEHKVRNLLEITIESLPEGRLLFKISGNNFLYKMVRNIVGTLVYIGCGKILLESLSQLIEAKDRRQIGMTAPAHGLFLHKIYYRLQKTAVTRA